MNSNVYFYYKSDKNIKCVIHTIEYNGWFTKNPKIHLRVTYNNNTQFDLVTTKYDFERLWSIST